MDASELIEKVMISDSVDRRIPYEEELYKSNDRKDGIQNVNMLCGSGKSR